jgi:hypothetical protein
VSKTKLTQQEKQEWDELYQYVKKDILQYDKSQSIPPMLVLRLKGLSTGKFIENTSIQNKANYTYKIILYTFQIQKQAILSAISKKEFKNEANKFNYICKIVENNLNDVYNRVLSAEKAKVKTEETKTDNLFHDGVEYQKRDINNKKINNKLTNLW